MFTYVIDDKGSTNAQDGCHDDTVMALAILLQVLLEGKGENFVPYQSEDENYPRPKTYKRLGMNIPMDIDQDEGGSSLEIAE